MFNEDNEITDDDFQTLDQAHDGYLITALGEVATHNLSPDNWDLFSFDDEWADEDAILSIPLGE